MSLKIVFMGTPDFSVPSLSELISNGFDVIRVYTQPPRRAGRGKALTKSPVHQFAEIMGIPVETPDSFRKPSVIDALEALNPDVACVVAYGQILPERALIAPRFGCLNLHASLLPRWRGAAPIQRAIMAGDIKTGVQIMQMAKGLDTGDILLSETVDISSTATSGLLTDRLSRIGATLWPRALAALNRGGLNPKPQMGEATYAHKIDKSESRLDWARPASDLECDIRGLSPFPGAWFEIGGIRVKVHMSAVEACSSNLPAGTTMNPGLKVACGTDALQILSVQPAGKGRMSVDEFLRGKPCPKGTLLAGPEDGGP